MGLETPPTIARLRTGGSRPGVLRSENPTERGRAVYTKNTRLYAFYTFLCEFRTFLCEFRVFSQETAIFCNFNLTRSV